MLWRDARWERRSLNDLYHWKMLTDRQTSSVMIERDKKNGSSTDRQSFAKVDSHTVEQSVSLEKARLSPPMDDDGVYSDDGSRALAT